MQPEKRHISILFCDMVGSTSLSEKLETEDFLYILNAYHQSVAQEITIQYGYVAQFLGDGVLAYFGYPTSFPNSEKRAVKAGLRIRESIEMLNERLQNFYHIEIAVRIGIHSGNVVIAECGIGGRKERLALGEAPNVSARIMALAQPNEVVVSEKTYQRIREDFSFKALGTYSLRGLRDQLQIYQPLSEK